MAGHCAARHGRARQAWRGMVRIGKARPGMAGKANMEVSDVRSCINGDYSCGRK
jgi:hypothetical protein